MSKMILSTDELARDIKKLRTRTKRLIRWPQEYREKSVKEVEAAAHDIIFACGSMHSNAREWESKNKREKRLRNDKANK
jgi:hypothetical protein